MNSTSHPDPSMRAHLKCHLTGSPVQHCLGVGDFIGRSEQAVLCVDDPRVSEAHSIISLRGSSLILLALRGRFRVKDKICTEIALSSGLDIELYKGCWLHCDEVILPMSLPGLKVQGLPQTLLTHTTSLSFTPAPELARGYQPDADVIFWPLGETWSYRVKGGEPVALTTNTSLELGTHTVEIVDIPLDVAAIPKTRRTTRQALHITVLPRSVDLHAHTLDSRHTLTGIPGKIFAAVARQDAPQTWAHIASVVWAGDSASESSMRRRFDVGMLRLREKLQQYGLPAHLIQMDGSGIVTLHLAEHDELHITS